MRRHLIAPALDAGGAMNTEAEQKTLPDSRIAKDLAAIWSRQFKGQTVYLEDNYFDMGGDSLNAADMLIRLEKINCSNFSRLE